MENKQLNLKEVLQLKEVQDGINFNIFNNQNTTDTSEDVFSTLLEGILLSEEDNNINIDATIDGKEVILENSLYEKKIYLLETRAFDKESEQMVGCYLQTIEPDGSIMPNPDDDVWGNTEWKLV